MEKSRSSESVRALSRDLGSSESALAPASVSRVMVAGDSPGLEPELVGPCLGSRSPDSARPLARGTDYQRWAGGAADVWAAARRGVRGTALPQRVCAISSASPRGGVGGVAPDEWLHSGAGPSIANRRSLSARATARSSARRRGSPARQWAGRSRTTRRGRAHCGRRAAAHRA